MSNQVLQVGTAAANAEGRYRVVGYCQGQENYGTRWKMKSGGDYLVTELTLAELNAIVAGLGLAAHVEAIVASHPP